ncbi:MAG: DUF5689 domain-containing protein [Muribaculaceae bacterium]|nr:DUF5689 domain-containing protein [Muribaculaceae bacterium]
MKSLLAAALLAVSGSILTGCDEELAQPPLNIPTSDWKANTTIQELKTQYWQDATNYCTEVTAAANGERVILGGRVIANDSTGNIYQNIVLQDATGALSISVAISDSYKKFKIGEEMFIDVTGLYAGKYAGLFQVGKEDAYNGTPQTGRMDESIFLEHVELNGLPKPSEVTETTMTIGEINGLTGTENLIKYQSQLVRINNVSFIGGGTETWAVQGSSGTNRYLIDAQGNRLLVRNSGMSDFNQQILPTGHGNVVGILSYYNGAWQFLFRSAEDCTDFQGESYAPKIEGDGTPEVPYTVGSVLAGTSGTGVWVTGYIVGWVEGQVLSSGAHFTTPATVSSNLLLAASPDETNVANCIPVQLTNGTTARTDLNLQDNPANLHRQVTLKGSLEAYFGASGIKSVTKYAWGDKGDESDTPDTPDTPTGDATFTLATTITSGHQYVMVVDGQIGEPIASNLSYGRLTMKAITISNGSLTTSVANAITITAVDGGYTMVDSYGRYLSMDDSHLTSFQLYTEQQPGSVWTITPSDGAMQIVNNVNTTCWVVRSGTYTNIAPSDVAQYPTYNLPVLYEKAN